MHRSALPGAFVLLWSTGFIGARLADPYIEPLTLLAIRMVIAASLLAVIALVTRASWPESLRMALHIAIAGLLVHATYLSGVFIAINLGQAAGVTAILVALQPLLTATLVGPLLGEQVTRWQWLGLILGLLGVIFVISGRIEGGIITAGTLAASLFALIGITLGTLYQKRFCSHADLRSGGAIQFAASAIVLIPAALLLETQTIEWTGELIFALAWLVLVLSVGAIGLLYTLIRRGDASRVASLFYLAPPFTVLLAWLFFGEQLGPSALLGLAVVVMGVALVQRRPAATT
ncbi:DMT family transporter [Spiribacter salilacus]|uniref:DMT family transporter n=1 Tax=Spiribacter salilacus TaxID=2664894 RepID=UPI001C12C204|nr:DMT family transporter [Spiribacter salilacus]